MYTHCWGTYPTTGLDITSKGHISHKEHYPLHEKHYLLLFALSCAYQLYALICIPNLHHIQHSSMLWFRLSCWSLEHTSSRLHKPIVWGSNLAR